MATGSEWGNKQAVNHEMKRLGTATLCRASFQVAVRRLRGLKDLHFPDKYIPRRFEADLLESSWGRSKESYSCIDQ